MKKKNNIGLYIGLSLILVILLGVLVVEVVLITKGSIKIPKIEIPIINTTPVKDITLVTNLKLAGDFKDSTGNSDGIATNVSFRVGRNNILAAYYTGGTAPNIKIPYTSKTALPNGQTIMAWVYLDTVTSTNHYISHKNNEFLLQLYTPNRTIINSTVFNTGVYINNQWNVQGAGASSKTRIIPKRWYHVAMTYDTPTKTMKIYVNGVLEGGNTATLPKSVSLEPTIIGNSGSGLSGRGMNGLISDYKEFNRVLTLDEIKIEMNKQI